MQLYIGADSEKIMESFLKMKSISNIPFKNSFYSGNEWIAFKGHHATIDYDDKYWTRYYACHRF